MRHKTKALALAMTAALAAGSVLAACTAGDDDLVAVVHVSAASPLASSAQKGVDRLRAEGHRTSRVTPGSGEEVEAMADAAGDGAVIVVGPGSAHPALMAALNEVAAEFPDERFLLYDGRVVANNITSITFRRNEAGFTAGVLAGLVTTRADQFEFAQGTLDVALVADSDTPDVRAYLAGFAAGAHAVDPLIQVQSTFVGDSTEVDRAYDLAATLFSANGADVVFAAQGSVQDGVFRAAQEAGRYAIGVAGAAGDAPGHVLALVEERVGDAVYSTFTGLKDGTLSWGQNVVLGLAEGVVGLTYDGAGDVVPQAVRDEVDAYSQRVVDFDIQVPES